MLKCQHLSNFGLLAVAKYKGSNDLKFPKSRVAQRVSDPAELDIALKIASGETICRSYECLPLTGIFFMCKKR